TGSAPATPVPPSPPPPDLGPLMAEAGEDALEVWDLDPDAMAGWSGDQWDRACRSGLLGRLPEDAWCDSPPSVPEGPEQSSTSSTSPDGGEDRGG
ncbi:MAG TPA: hypothetical protein VEW26_11970, partial [Allosphingosinicella sp.]|nr:hypothetical protein [Allosphingosinicella sp.]